MGYDGVSLMNPSLRTAAVVSGDCACGNRSFSSSLPLKPGEVDVHPQQSGLYSGMESSWVTISVYFWTLIFDPVLSQD